MAAAVALLLFLCASISAAAPPQGYLNISLGSSLTPHTNSAWLSSSGIFAFGFYDTPDGNAVCIYFASFKERTVVWTANSEDPIVPDNLVLLLTEDGLVLQESESQSVFSRIDNSSQPIAWASMLDSGNFALYNSDGSVVWQSFDNPTDSFLPGQPIPSGGMLLSRASETDLKTGIFRLRMQLDSNLVLYYVYGLDGPGDSYYSSATNNIGSNVSLNLENDGRLYLFNGWSALLNLTTGGNPVVGTIYLARLDWDGIFRLYNRSLHKEDDWISIWSVTEDKCLPKGLCGVNSFCSFQHNYADCKCLPGFGLVQSGQWSTGCTNNIMVDCTDKDQSSKYEMTSILNVTWEDNYYGASKGITEEHCKQGCLEDCNCIVALFKDGECRKQKLPLSYGRWSAEVPDMAFVRVIKSPVNPGKNVESLPHSDIHIISIALVILPFAISFLSGIITAEAFLMFDVAVFLSGSRGPSGHKRRHLQKHVVIGNYTILLHTNLT